MSSTNKTTYYELSQYVGSDKPTYLGDYNGDMLKIDTAIHTAANNADTALTTANAANSAATSASTTAGTALSTAQTASATATQAQTTAETALTNSRAAQTAAEEAETAARANVITNLAPDYDPSLTYDVDDLVTYIDAQGSGKMYKCIVAITTPEAFNINKWDDVTCSEYFETKHKIISIFVGDGVKTIGDMLKQFCAVCYNLKDEFINAHYYYLDSNDPLRVENIYRASQKTSSIVCFSNIYGNATSLSASLVGCTVSDNVFTPFSCKISAATNTTPTYVQDLTSNVIATGKTYYLAV